MEENVRTVNISLFIQVYQHRFHSLSPLSSTAIQIFNRMASFRIIVSIIKWSKMFYILMFLNGSRAVCSGWRSIAVVSVKHLFVILIMMVMISRWSRYTWWSNNNVSVVGDNFFVILWEGECSIVLTKILRMWMQLLFSDDIHGERKTVLRGCGREDVSSCGRLKSAVCVMMKQKFVDEK